MYAIKAIIILDIDGKRVLAKYYTDMFPTLKSQSTFESKLFNKTNRTPCGEITLFEGTTCVYKSNVDLFFYIVGDISENELILISALNCLYDSIGQILKRSVEKKMLVDNLDLIFLAIDELCDEGVLLECDASSLASRVGSRPDDIPLSEQTVVQRYYYPYSTLIASIHSCSITQAQKKI
ncbi:unnamed protein product [Protopolystoma xenopodis]|uniref:Coatomer subunit zeta n=1 Tax=Protopolystoma xenopodis TaxID=117903 RepID=A0A448WYP2_9PLAT|nr:unnamed protein product [Protopolystoma xenopodis]